MTETNWRLGLLYAGITALAWGLLPIALKVMLRHLDPYTITWFRFLVSALATGAWLAAYGGLPRLGRLDGRGRLLLVLAVLGLTGNYVLYLVGLSFITPGAAQVLIQLAPMFLLLGGLLVFGERFGRRQWLGFAVLVAGLLLFFHDRLESLATVTGPFARGILLLLLAAVTWAVYALAQKGLGGRMSSQGILLVIYAAASLLLLPAAAPAALGGLTPWAWFLLAFCSVNTLVAYGSFGEALRHWEASRISAVLAVTPLLTLAFSALIEALPVGYHGGEQVDALSLAGAGLVVAGSAACALGGARRAPAPAVGAASGTSVTRG